MMKKFIALGLCLLMVLSVCLTGCSEKTNEEAVADISKKASKSAITLSLYLMSEVKVDKCEHCEKADAGEAGAKTCVDLNTQPCTFRLISNAVNRVTESKFKTRLVLHYYTEAEYYQKLEESFAKREAAKQAGLIGNAEFVDESAEDETFINDLGQVQIKYPSIEGYQVDIFYFGGQEKFDQYVKGGLLADIDGQLSDASKQLKKYISGEFLDNVKTLGGGKTYAIPTNRTVGQYTYLLLNKQAFDKANRNFNESDYKDITSALSQEFFDDVQSMMSDTYYPIKLGEGVSISDIATLNMNFFGVDANGRFSTDFSLIGGYYQSGQDSFAKSFGYAAASSNTAKVMANKEFESKLRALKQYQVNDYFDETAEKFAVGYLKGDVTILDQYRDEYEIFVVEAPRMDATDLCEHMMGVSSTTSSVERSMQILTLLNTDEEFRNLILYGIEGEHYRVIDTMVVKNESGDTYKKVERLNNSYLMDENKTGNVFIAYPLQEVGENVAPINPAIRDLGIQQNRDLVVDRYLSFALQDDFEIDMVAMQTIRQVSEEIWAEYETCTDFETFWTNAKAKAQSVDSALSDMTKYTHGNGNEACTKVCGSFGCAFTEWAVEQGIITKAEK